MHHIAAEVQLLLRFEDLRGNTIHTRYSFPSSGILNPNLIGRHLLEVNMKKLALAAALAAAASTASAGSMEEPVVEPVIIEEDTGGSDGGWIIPVLLLALVAVAAAGT